MFANGKFLLKPREINFHIFQNNSKLYTQEMKTISKNEETICYT